MSRDPIEELARRLAAPTETGVRVRRAVVTAFGANALTIDLGGTSVAGVQYLSSYVPIVNDVVSVLQAGPDLLVIGSSAAGGGISFRAEASATQSIPNTTWTTTTQATPIYNHGGGWDDATDTFTAPVPGNYVFTGFVPFAANATGGRFLVFAVGGTRARSRVASGTSSVSVELNIHNEFELAAGDTVVLQAYQQSGAALNTVIASPDIGVVFAGHLIR